MSKINDLGIKEFPPKGLFIDHNEDKRIAYKKGINDTLGALICTLKKSPESLPEFVDNILKFIEGYYE